MTRFLPDITGVEQCVKHQFDGKNNPRPAFGLKFCFGNILNFVAPPLKSSFKYKTRDILR